MHWLLLLAAAGLPAPGAAQARLSPNALQEDFRVFRTALEEGHSGIYRYTSKKELDLAFDRGAAHLVRPLTWIEFRRLLAPIVAAIKCGHTSINVPDAEAAAPVLLLPMEVEALDDRLYIRRDYAAGDRKLAGQEILGINGVAAGRILAAMLAVIPGDGDSPTLRRWRIRPNFRGLLHLELGIESPFTLELRDPRSSRQQTVGLDGLPSAELQAIGASRYPQDRRPENAAEFRFADDGRIAVFKIYGFGGKAGPEGKPLGEYFDDVFRQMRNRGSQALILDLRDNGGGADELGKKLFSFLTAEPFRYYDDLVINQREFSFFPFVKNARPIPADRVERGGDGKFHEISHPNWGIQQPSKPYFSGKVLALMNGGSFSTTCEFLSTLHFHKRAVFLGEEAGGGYYGNTSGIVPEVVLPNSKLRLRVPLVTYYLAVSGMPKARSIPPDVAVHYTIEEQLSGIDKEMDLALRLAREGAVKPR